MKKIVSILCSLALVITLVSTPSSTMTDTFGSAIPVTHEHMVGA